MARLGWLTFLFLASSASATLAAPDYSGTWEIGVREFGGANYYLPMQDGRLVLEASGDSYKGRFNQISFSGSLQKDELHLSCNEQGRDCGQLVLQLSGNQLSGKGELIASSPSSPFGDVGRSARRLGRGSAASMIMIRSNSPTSIRLR